MSRNNFQGWQILCGIIAALLLLSGICMIAVGIIGLFRLIVSFSVEICLIIFTIATVMSLLGKICKLF